MTLTPALTVNGRIESKRGKCLIDTGSQITLVNKSVVESEKWQPTSRRIQGVTGTPLTIYGDADCKISLPGAPTIRAQASVVDLPDNYIAIIGLDIQKRHGALLDIGQGKVYFQKQPTEPQWEWEAKHPSYLVTADHTILPPRTVAAIPAIRKGSADNHNPQALCPIEIPGISIAKSLHGQCLNTVVMLCNYSDKIVEMNKNSKIGYLEQVETLEKPTNCMMSASLSCMTDPPNATESEKETFLKFVREQAKGFEHQDELAKRIGEYYDVFSFPGYEKLGVTSLTEHSIPTGDHKPVRTRQYKIPFKQREILDNIVKEHLSDGIIRPGTGAWQSPCLLVPKRTLIGGETKLSWRMVVDFRKVNKVTQPEFFPLPLVHDCIDQMAGSNFFTTLDLRSGYHQVRIKEEDIEKTGFSTHTGSWVFNRMPFGLSNAPATFQKLATQLIKSLGSTRALAFLDDVVLFHASWQEQLDDLCKFLQILREANLKLQLVKCNFLQKEVHYLGHRIGSEGIKPDDRKIEAVQNFPIPSTVTQVKAFLGLCSYYRRFVKSFAKEAQPLFELTKKDVPFHWGEAQTAAFQNLKGRLISSPILKYPDFEKEFILSTDASKNGLGAVLSQNHDGKEHPIAYASRALNKAEKNYSATELELLAIIFAVRHFHQYLYGVKFTILTDHAALRYLHQMKDTNSRILRWSLLLEEYAYTPKYKSGAKHTNADGLSRAFVVITTLEEEEMKNEQSRDTFCQLAKGQAGYSFTDQGILAKNSQGSLRLLVPKTLRTRVLELAHSSTQGGHCGQKKTLQTLRAKYYWPGMKKQTECFVRSCPQCALIHNHGRGKPTLGEFREPKETFEAISVDVVGPLPLTPGGYKYILTIIDQFSRYVQFYPMQTQTAEEVAQNLVRHIARFGASKRLLSDQGKNFTSELIRHLCEFFQVDKLQTTAYHPAGNGRCERVHRTMSKILSHFVNSTQTDWDQKLPLVELVINSHCNETTSFPPFTVVFGKPMPLPARDDLTLQPTTEPYALQVEDLRETLLDLWDSVDKMQAASKSRMYQRYNQGKSDYPYKTGDLVYLHNTIVKKGKTKKFTKPWLGPYPVLVVHSPQNVTIKQGTKDVRVHTSRLKPYVLSYNIESEPDTLLEQADLEDFFRNPAPSLEGRAVESTGSQNSTQGREEQVPALYPTEPPPSPHSGRTNRYNLRAKAPVNYGEVE